jgi:ABC-type multidrug transport system ATPase subunit
MLMISGLSKTYRGGVCALRKIDLEIPRGMFGLLGPNGAGKTTLMKILATLLDADEGQVTFDGIDALKEKAAVRSLLGYLPQDFGLYPTLTAWQMLDYLARLKGVIGANERSSQIDALLERVNLSSERARKLGEFSGGMRQRFAVAQALLGDPKLLIVDEPTAGLDPQERVRFHNLLSDIASDVVVLLSTHIVSDVSNICSRMAIIRRGEIIATREPRDALGELTGRVWEATVAREEAARLKPRLAVVSSQMYAGDVRLRVISDNGCPGDGFAPASPTLEDYYFSLVNRPAREG